MIEAFKDLPDFAKLLGGGVALAGLATSLGGITKAVTGLVAVAAGLAPITAFLGAATLFANAPAIGRKVAEILDKTEGGQKAGDFLAGSVGFLREGGNPLLASIAGILNTQRNPIVVNNNITNNVNGVQNPQVISSELDRSQRAVTQDTLNKAQAAQGNGIR